MNFEKILRDNNLKVTPQRVAVLEAVNRLNSHPTADEVRDSIQKKYPGIATGTIYKILDILVEKGLVKKVKTGKDIMRYDGMLKKHHHLYSRNTEDILDYFDEDLDRMLDDYFLKKSIPGFVIEDIKLQISGRLDKKN
ncbi:MAG: transcriptional repressor [Bacteroidales bacterium]|jgi:Fur family peroxide stress response transcriptional regulator|nr:transcriptional repressor [Bacteroidales bacterium]